MKRKIYVNKKQWAFLRAAQKIRTWIGGRGSGKTRVIAYLIRIMVLGLKFKIGDKTIVYEPMKRCRIVFLAPTVEQLKTKIWPEVQDGLSAFGLKEDEGPKAPGHFVVGKVPPKWFAKPRKQPKKYDNVVTFFNGFSIDMIGFHLNDRRRGGSYDALILDEALEVDESQFNKSISPLVRGNQHNFKHPLKEGRFIFSSRPWKQKAKWIDTKMKRLAIDKPDKYFYIESSAKDNIEVLGPEYFENLRDTLSPIEYAVEVDNQQVTRIPNCYYDYLDDEKHSYTPRVDYTETNGTYTITREHDVNQGHGIDVSFDFNSAFTSLTSWQEFLPGKNDEQTGLPRSQWELRCLRSFFVKNTLVDKLVDKFCDHYKDHPDNKKIVNVYGGGDAMHEKKALTEKTYMDRILAQFSKRGWKSYNRIDYRYADIAHKTTHDQVNQVLRENDGRLPVVRINDQAASDVLISMGNAPIKGDFKKDKSSERDEHLPQEFATHLSDTFDNYVIPKSQGQYRSVGAGGLSSSAWT